MLTILATGDPFSGLFPSSLPTIHDNASPAVESFFDSGLLPQLLTLFTANIGTLLIGVGIWTVLLVVGWLADNVLKGRAAVKGFVDDGLF